MNPKVDKQLLVTGLAAWDATADYSLPKLKRLPSVWATEERRIPAGTSPISGGEDIRYNHSVMPHCVEQMDAADDPEIQTIVIWAAVRDAKTSVCINIIGRTVTDDPGGIYSVHPIADDAALFSQNDIEPTIEATPALKSKFVEIRSRDTGRTIENKKFVGGWLRIIGSNSLTKFRGTSVKVLLMHEVDALNVEAIYAAFGRQTGFRDAIRILESTCTIAAYYDPEGKKIYRSKIEEWYDKGDKRKWFCPCRECGHLQVLLYENLKWPVILPEKAALNCVKCDAAHDEKQWRKMVLSGKWYPTAGLTEKQEEDILANYRLARAAEPQVRSYWRNGFCNLFPHGKGFKSKLHQFVVEGESAKSSMEGLQRWENEVAARTWNPETSGEAPPQWKPIYDRRENYGLTIPKAGLVLTAFVDCQLNRLEVGWRVFGRREESWGMDHVVLDGHVRDSEVWKALRFELARKFKHESGADITLTMALIDGGHYAEDVYRFFRELAANPVPGVSGHCRASKGIGHHGHPLIDQHMRTVAKNLKGHHLGTWEAKDRIYERLRMTPEPSDDRAGIMHFNEQFTEEMCQQMVSEVVTVTWEKGAEVRKYINPKQARNEQLDILVGQLAAFRLHPRNLDAIEARITQAATEKNQIVSTSIRAKIHEEEQRGNSSVTVAGWR